MEWIACGRLQVSVTRARGIVWQATLQIAKSNSAYIMTSHYLQKMRFSDLFLKYMNLVSMLMFERLCTGLKTFIILFQPFRKFVCLGLQNAVRSASTTIDSCHCSSNAE